MSDAPTFTVVLHHLAPGAKQAGVTFPDTELSAISDKKLRELIRALATLASTNLGAASPELRVTAPHGQFVVKISEARLRINSWTIKVGGADLSPDQIVALITGTEAVAESVGLDITEGATKRSRGGMIAVLGILILGTNALTAWMLTRPGPPPPLLPDFAPLAKEPAERLIADIAGEYLTAPKEGARGLKIGKDGQVRWTRLGAGGALAEDEPLPVQPVQSHGRPALLADGRALIEVADAGALLFYNETYRRKTP